MAACWLRPTAARPSGVGWSGPHEYRLRVAVERWQPGAVLLADFPGRTVRLVSAAHAEPAAPPATLPAAPVAGVFHVDADALPAAPGGLRRAAS